MPQKPLSVPLFCQNLTTVILCYHFLANCKRSKILLQDFSSKLGSRNTSNPFVKNSTGYQSAQESNTKSQPCATIFFSETYPLYLSELLTVYSPSRQPRSVLDTKTFRIPLTKTKTFLENELFLSQARNNGTHCHMMSVTHHPYFLLRKH